MIEFNDEKNLLTIKQKEFIYLLLEYSVAYEKIQEEIELSVTFTNNQEIQKINQDYRNINQPTDVISFALEDTIEDEIEIKGLTDMSRMLGDIIVSVERAIEQSKEYKHSLERELGFLTVHGFLHLLGYDHMNKDDEKIMFSKQDEILRMYGLER